ncbi:MAG: hypothetical protein V1918_05840, partial [Planctomycetota bacterium]
SFSGDLMVEVYMAQMMDRERGNYKNYLRDFNLAICADGKDLTSGYSCIFGGWLDAPGQGPKSAIVRRGRIVAEKPDPILSSGGIHRRWNRVRVVKQGGRILFTAHSQFRPQDPERELLRLSFDDPEPLTGTRIAIWSYDCGVLLARARISAEEEGPLEEPLALWPSSVTSVYNAPAELETPATSEAASPR